MLYALKEKAAEAARRAGLATGGLLCILVGAVFLTSALWMMLVAAYDAPTAALVLGGGYLGLGLILIGLARRGASETQINVAETQQPTADAPALVNAFLAGLREGASSGKKA